MSNNEYPGLSHETQSELFPSFDGNAKVPEILIDLVDFSSDIGVPFPAEPNPQYSVWWRSLHEIAHWAVNSPS
jgi:hypothetical protein